MDGITFSLLPFLPMKRSLCRCYNSRSKYYFWNILIYKRLVIVLFLFVWFIYKIFSIFYWIPAYIYKCSYLDCSHIIVYAYEDISCTTSFTLFPFYVIKTFRFITHGMDFLLKLILAWKKLGSFTIFQHFSCFLIKFKILNEINCTFYYLSYDIHTNNLYITIHDILLLLSISQLCPYTNY